MSTKKLQQLAGVGVGDVVTSKHIREITKRTESFFQSIGFERPDVEVNTYGDPLSFQLQVTTKHCWLLRVWEREDAGKEAFRDQPSFRRPDPLGEGFGAHAEQRGWSRSDFEDWRTILPFGESGVFDREESERGVAAIRKILEGRGFLFAEVAMDHRNFKRQASASRQIRSGPVRGIIDYRLTRNHERRIEKITLKGHEAFSAAELLAERQLARASLLAADAAAQDEAALDAREDALGAIAMERLRGRARRGDSASANLLDRENNPPCAPPGLFCDHDTSPDVVDAINKKFEELEKKFTAIGLPSAHKHSAVRLDV